MELTESQKMILHKISTYQKPPTLAKLKQYIKNITEEDIISLVNLGLIEEFKDKPNVKGKYRLTELGMKVYQELPPIDKKPKRTGRSSRKTTSSDLAQIVYEAVSQALAPLISSIQELHEALADAGIIKKKSPLAESSKHLAASITLEEFKTRLQQEYERINRETRSGGMVRIPDLWRSMSHWINKELFVKYLFDLEEQRVIDLQIASDERLVSSPEEGIRHPTRGLIYYIVWR